MRLRAGPGRVCGGQLLRALLPPPWMLCRGLTLRRWLLFYLFLFLMLLVSSINSFFLFLAFFLVRIRDHIGEEKLKKQRKTSCEMNYFPFSAVLETNRTPSRLLHALRPPPQQFARDVKQRPPKEAKGGIIEWKVTPELNPRYEILVWPSNLPLTCPREWRPVLHEFSLVKWEGGGGL